MAGGSSRTIPAWAPWTAAPSVWCPPGSSRAGCCCATVAAGVPVAERRRSVPWTGRTSGWPYAVADSSATRCWDRPRLVPGGRWQLVLCPRLPPDQFLHLLPGQPHGHRPVVDDQAERGDDHHVPPERDGVGVDR